MFAVRRQERRLSRKRFATSVSARLYQVPRFQLGWATGFQFCFSQAVSVTTFSARLGNRFPIMFQPSCISYHVLSSAGQSVSNSVSAKLYQFPRFQLGLTLPAGPSIPWKGLAQNRFTWLTCITKFNQG
jgi:hypothetical protein